MGRHYVGTMSLTRKQFLKLAATTLSVSAVGGLTGCGGNGGGTGASGNAELRRADPSQAIFDATGRYPLVGLSDSHMCEQFHAWLRSLVKRPWLPRNVHDIVVEFGNALYQDIADRFFLDLQSVGDTELSTIWRNTLGGRVYWDAPVYEQFYRTVRSVNELLSRERRIRVVLGDVPIEWSQIHSAADADKVPGGDERETFYAGVVEREVLAKHRRALLVIGGNHLRRGIHTNPDELSPPRNPNQATAGTILAKDHPGTLFVVFPFAAINTAVHSLPPGVPERVGQTLRSWPVPSLAALTHTWLGRQTMPDRALDPHSAIQDQLDALLWLGPDQRQTCSRADPALYQSGDYADELRRRSQILSQISGRPVDLVAEGLHLASLGPSCSMR